LSCLALTTTRWRADVIRPYKEKLVKRQPTGLKLNNITRCVGEPNGC
jgi:hypothetical protein